MIVSKNPGFKFFYLTAAMFLLAYVFVTIKDLHEWGGWLLMLFFVSLSLAFRSTQSLKGLSFTVIIFAAVSMALYHPEYFQQWG